MADETRKIAHLVGTTAQGMAGGGRKGLLMHDTDIGTLKMQLDAGGAYAIYARRDAAQTFTGLQTFTDGVKDSTLTAGGLVVAGTGGRLSTGTSFSAVSAGFTDNLVVEKIVSAGQYRLQSIVTWSGSTQNFSSTASLYRYTGTVATTLTVGVAANYIFYVCNAGTGVVTIQPAAGTVNGESTFSVPPGNGAVVVSNGTEAYAYLAGPKYRAYAQIYRTGAAVAQSIPTGTSWTKVTPFTANSSSSLNATPDYTNHKITVTRAGTYKATFSRSFSVGTANTTWCSTLLKTTSGGATSEVPEFTQKIDLLNAAKSTYAETSAQVTLNAGDSVSYAVYHTSASSVTISYDYATLSIEAVD